MTALKSAVAAFNPTPSIERSAEYESWRCKGATGFGTLLLVDLALNFTRPASRS